MLEKKGETYSIVSSVAVLRCDRTINLSFGLIFFRYRLESRGTLVTFAETIHEYIDRLNVNPSRSGAARSTFRLARFGGA